MKEIKIGEEIRIRCVEDTRKTRITSFGDCSRCFFNRNNCDQMRKICGAEYRTDKKNVHFELMENEYN